MKTLLLTILTIVSIAVTAFGSTNVFNDALFWFRGGNDCVVADGQLQQGEFFDDLHANDTSHNNHKMTVSGYSENAQFIIDDVVIPALGITNRMQVLRISDNMKDGLTSRLCVCPYNLFAQNNISNKYTIACRLKFDSLDGQKWILKIGSNGQTGLKLGFANHPNYPGCKYVLAWIRKQAGDSGGSGSHFYDAIIPTNMWVDLSVVVGNGKLRVGIASANSVTIKDNNNNNKYTPTLAFQELPMATEILSVRPSSQSSWYSFFSPSTTDSERFVGSVQQLAVWGRMLSDCEIMEAFGMPRPGIFRTGLKNGLSEEFGGTRSASEQRIDGLGSWQNVTDTMLAGDVWNINFEALRDEAGLTQFFSVHSLPGSSPSSLSAILNGTSLGSRHVGSNGCVFWPVASNLLLSGSNTLTLRRTDDGAGAFLVDAMELGGSIGIGQINDNAYDGMIAPGQIKNGGVPSSADVNLQHWPQLLLSYDGISNVNFRVWVDPVVNSRASFRFRLRTKCQNRGGEHIISGDETFSLLVNGEVKTVGDANTGWKEQELHFAPGDLFDGWNEVELKTAPYGSCYWLIDYYRFETMLLRGFSIPPKGMILSFR